MSFQFVTPEDWNWLNKRIDACLQSPLTQSLSIHNGYDIIWYSDAGVTEKARIDGATGNISTLGYEDMTQMSTPSNPGSGIRRIFVDSGTGKLSVRTNGGSTVSLEEQGGSLTLNQVLGYGNAATGYSILVENGYDIIWYSDAGTTEKARIDGATGNITTVGTVDGADISAHAHTGSDGTVRVAPAAISAEDTHTSDATDRSTTGTSWTADTNLTSSLSCAVGDVVLVITSGIFYGASTGAIYYYRLKVNSGTATVLARTDYFVTQHDNTEYAPGTLFLTYRCTSASTVVVCYEYYTSSASYAAHMFNRQMYAFKVGYTAS